MECFKKVLNLMQSLFFAFLCIGFISCAGGAGGGCETDVSALCVQVPRTKSVQYEFSDVEIFTVTVQSSSYTSTKSCGQGEKITFSNIPVGHYEVVAFGKKSDGSITAKGTASVDIVADVTKQVTIRLSRLYYNTVSFYKNSDELLSSQQVNVGEKIIKPANPTDTGHTFSFWSTSSDKAVAQPFNFNSPVNENITLYAIWDAGYFEITWNSDVTTDDDLPDVYASETGLALPELSHTVYRFDGWYEDEDFTEASKVTSIPAGSTGVKTFYAKWLVTVTFDSKGGTDVDSAEILYNTAVSEPSSEPTKTDCLFDGWYTSSDGGETLSSTAYDFTSSVDEALTLYAKWLHTDFMGTAAEFLAADFASNTLATSYNVVITSATNDQIKQIGKALGKSTDANYKGVYVNLILTDCGATEILEGAFCTADSWGAGSDIATYLTGITLPSGLTKIEDSAFAGCTNLTGTVTLPATCTYLGYGCLDAGFTGIIHEDATSVWVKYKYDGTVITSGMTGFASTPFSGSSPSLAVINATSQGITYLRKQ